ncbi:hypothetical protein SDC9_61874 [bioreactor metagenome]|uniref:Tripartite ATP-independent periplasmic transporters DctQ component domain-containing protein n=1 Tax=bioreactor metagenome TaxID=1076179 RepID=A0A644XMK8_9ZZZZ
MSCNKPRSSLFFSGIELLLGIAGLTAILLVTLGVITRFVFQISIAWSDELLRTVFVWAYFIGTALLYRANGGLMRLELLEDYLKGKKLAGPVAALQGFLMMSFSGAVAFYLFGIMRQQVLSGQITTTSNTPAWVSPLGFFIGMVLLTFFVLRDLVSKSFLNRC